MYVNESIKDLYRVKFHEDRANVLRLDMNESPEGLPLSFVEEVKRQITPEFLATYPQKDRLVQQVSAHCGLRADQITITNGSDEAMRLAFQCFGERGKKVVTVTPTFEMYGVYAAMFGMEHVTIGYNADFTIPVDQLLASIDETTGIVVILNPNSPIGVTYTEDEARAIIEKAGTVGALVVIDEAYHYFYEPTFMPLIAQYRNVIVLRTFSKLCAIAGLRVGYAAGNAQLIDYMEKAESTFNVSNVGLLFAEEILKRPDLMEAQRKAEAEGRGWLTEQLVKAGYQVLSLEGNFILFKPKGNAGDLVAALKKRGVWIRDYSSGMLAGYLRISTGCLDYMRRFWDAFTVVEE
ncbi:pyridoxal phosphate-dependent aminotransferase [Cohnella zeiphila]|uniref:Aminotransferase class I/II-fold pyridoxal phosphate-dependent enzyme n=1 Tax=Cohnella zeiphila TaxID=2761120 RepID=A0A7X0SLJ8_9BACL|nr:aminotransferase class I/II-fold pyridoxal phosphate-dependent enzyme [Cohnella zeiphila]MBB6732245.1 aminotransferase class I/II-fold pyridoxal phosphate-dependent enzyme [Cohnella zeiphila]